MVLGDHVPFYYCTRLTWADMTHKSFSETVRSQHDKKRTNNPEASKASLSLSSLQYGLNTNSQKSSILFSPQRCNDSMEGKVVLKSFLDQAQRSVYLHKIIHKTVFWFVLGLSVNKACIFMAASIQFICFHALKKLSAVCTESVL